jgi:hypothetical protein
MSYLFVGCCAQPFDCNTTEVAMKQLSKTERAAARKKFRDSANARLRAKAKLIEDARAAEDDAVPQDLLPDRTEDAWFRRHSAALDAIQERGGFSHDVAMLAITDESWETKETVATWLRSEVKAFREAEARPGAAVRLGKVLSKTEISELAVELLQCVAGQELICLFQELLDVDRHRKSLADAFVEMDRAAEVEAMTLLQGLSMRVRQFARHVSVAPSTVTRWRRSETFQARVKFHSEVWAPFLRESYFEDIVTNFPQATEPECFGHAFRMYFESLPKRQKADSRGRRRSTPSR